MGGRGTRPVMFCDEGDTMSNVHFKHRKIFRTTYSYWFVLISGGGDNPCDPNPCKNGGSCTNGDCDCRNPWVGITCEGKGFTLGTPGMDHREGGVYTKRIAD